MLGLVTKGSLKRRVAELERQVDEWHRLFDASQAELGRLVALAEKTVADIQAQSAAAAAEAPKE